MNRYAEAILALDPCFNQAPVREATDVVMRIVPTYVSRHEFIVGGYTHGGVRTYVCKWCLQRLAI